MQRNSFGIWCHIEYFPLADNCQMTCRHVANSVGTGLARGEIDFCKPSRAFELLHECDTPAVSRRTECASIGHEAQAAGDETGVVILQLEVR